MPKNNDSPVHTENTERIDRETWVLIAVISFVIGFVITVMILVGG